MDNLRIGVIGAGCITAILHLPELAQLAGAEVAVIADRKESR